MVIKPQHLKYLFAGCTAAGVDLLLLHVFTAWVGIWYLYSAVLAFALALGVSFTLQKFWVFLDHSLDGVHRQLVMHATLGVVSTGLNTIIMYLLVSGVGLHYLVAQIIGGGLIAVINFFVYRKIIFKNGLAIF